MVRVAIVLLAICCLAVAGFPLGFEVVTPANAQTRKQTVDLLIRHGLLVNGTGKKPVRRDVGIRGDRIVFIGDATKARITAAREVDANGMIVAPGFIDPHTHALEDLLSENRRANVNYLMQGVTTVVAGNDGGSPLNLSETFTKLERQGIGTNTALYVGQGTVRRTVMGMSDAAPTPDQLQEMKALVGRAMDDGALGLSTGLFYAPGNFAKTEEIIELAKVAAEHGGIYDTHMRDEGSYSIGFLGSIRETIRIGKEAHIPVHIAHIKALGTDVWGQSRAAIRLIKQARAGGVEVTADQYPYTASGTALSAALVPRWAEVGGQSELVKRIDDPGTRPRLMDEMEKNLKRRGGPESLLLTSSSDRGLKGKTLKQIADERHQTPVEAALGIIKEVSASVASFNMNEADIVNFMKQGFVMTGSDGSSGHPRKFGTFPKKLHEYVFQKGVISLPFAIRASSGLTAKSLRIPERGTVAVGNYADVIVFDPRTIADTATYEQPEQLSVGMKYVIVNGQVAVDQGKYTGALAGRAVRKR